MDAIVCQAEDIKNVEIVAVAPAQTDSISTLTSAEMSFVGGGTCVVIFQ